MAKLVGKRFSDREETQSGSTNSRAVTKKGTTNKNDTKPSLTSDFMEDRKRDKTIINKEDKPAKGAAANAQAAAKERAASRVSGQNNRALVALSAGYGIGRIAGNMGGDELVRKGIDKSGLGEKIDKAAAGDRVELSKESKARIAAGDLEKGNDERVNKQDFPTYKKDTKSAEAFRKEFKDAKESGKDSFGFEGREYNTKDKEMNKGGMIRNKGIGASMKPHNVFGKKK